MLYRIDREKQEVKLLLFVDSRSEITNSIVPNFKRTKNIDKLNKEFTNIVDLKEVFHAFGLDYQECKKLYLENQQKEKLLSEEELLINEIVNL